MSVTPIPNVGIHRNIPADDYHNWDAVRCSHLKLFERSPAHAHFEIQSGGRTSDAMVFGSALHSQLLEPELFDDQFIISPKVDRRTKAGKAAWAEHQAMSEGRDVITQEDHKLILQLGKSVRRHPLAVELLKGAVERELSIAWDDEDTGLRCKARIDLVSRASGFVWLVDLKTTRDGSPRGFGRAIAQYQYDLQAAMYLQGLNVLGPADRRFAFIAIEKEPPFEVAVYELEQEDLEIGEKKFRAYLDQWASCAKLSTWPGYGTGLMLPRIPRWNRIGWDELEGGF